MLIKSILDANTVNLKPKNSNILLGYKDKKIYHFEEVHLVLCDLAGKPNTQRGKG